MSIDPEHILEFWFADAANDPRQAKNRYDFWFKATREIDNTIRTRFSELMPQALAGGLAAWEEQPHSWLALLILLDQFPRNLFRGTAQAFETDPFAQQIARRGFDRGFDSSLSVMEQLFSFMPYQHAEDVKLQEESVRLGDALLATAPTEWAAFIENFQGSARKHLSLIQRFGRFPHRNVLLGREMTLEEQAYLDAGSGFFGQAPKK